MNDDLTAIEKHQALVAEVTLKAQQRWKEVMEQREEIMTAFIAKYRCQPEEMVQVEWRKSASEMLWFLVKKSDCIFCEKCKEVIAKEKENDNQ